MTQPRSTYEAHLRRSYSRHLDYCRQRGRPAMSFSAFCLYLADRNARLDERRAKRQAKRQVVTRDGTVEYGVLSAKAASLDDDASRHTLDRMVRQESGLTVRGEYTAVGEGCWRRATHKHG